MEKVTLLKGFTEVLRARPNGTPLSSRDWPAGEAELSKSGIEQAKKAGALADDPPASPPPPPGGAEAPAPKKGADTSSPASVKG